MSINLHNISDFINPLLEQIKLRKGEPELPLRTLPMLSEKMWGIRKRKLTIIGARTSHGKSAFAVQVCLDLAMQNKKVIFLSLEMENMECVERVLAYGLEIHNRKLLRGEIENLEEKSKALKKILDNKFFMISDAIGKTWQEINEIVELWHSNGTVPDVIILDYIQNIKGFGTAKEQYDEYIRRFREMAIRYNFAAVICSQVNRSSQEGDDKSPQLHQLKGTGFLEEHSDIVLLLYWPRSKNDPNHFEINLAKNKLGETGWLNFRYYPEYFMFREPE